MENCWVDALNPRLTEFGHQLLGMYLWGIQDQFYNKKWGNHIENRHK